MNRVLAILGLVKISRARRLTRLLHIFYVESVADGAEKDFKIPPVKGFKKLAREWWDKEFDSILTHNENVVEIKTKPEFKEFITT